MRILIERNSMNDQSIEIMQYHKLQGFIYSKLINQSQFKDIHDLKTYKYVFFIKYVNKLGVFRYLIVYIII
jgi:CRISPR/Cas system endoribonuclease Cas6 (RAMP superfamily)